MTSKSSVGFLSVWASVFTTVCRSACVRGEGHNKGLHLVIIAGCVISATCLRIDSGNGVHVLYVCVRCAMCMHARRPNNPLM